MHVIHSETKSEKSVVEESSMAIPLRQASSGFTMNEMAFFQFMEDWKQEVVLVNEKPELTEGAKARFATGLNWGQTKESTLRIV